MTSAVDAAVSLVLASLWVFGIVLAKGFWSTVAAILCPPWGWYLVAEAILNGIGCG